jgi:DNA-binding NarL/FixJ family response regulator
MTILSDIQPLVEGWEAGAGLEALERDDLLAWSAVSEISLVLVTAESSDSWSLIADLRRLESEPIILVLLVEATLDSYVRAMTMGVSGVASRDASPELIRRVAVEALQGRCLLPREVVVSLVARLGATRSGHRPLDRDVEWLRALAQGTSIMQMAVGAGYSERTMYRLLNGMYRRIGAKNRTEAILLATQSGWL